MIQLNLTEQQAMALRNFLGFCVEKGVPMSLASFAITLDQMVQQAAGQVGAKPSKELNGKADNVSPTL